jgi:malonyl-CoA/methylmalonyl-CoA synthetase
MSVRTRPWDARLAECNLAELLAARCVENAAPFLHCDDGRIFTFAAFHELAGLLAYRLLAAGAKPGDRIAAQVEKSPEAIALFWACARAGLILLPLNAAYTASEVSNFISDAEPAIFITTPQRETELAKVAGVRLILTLDDTGGGSLMTGLGPGISLDHPSSWDDIAAILYTSGTTGRSKGAMLSHGNLASNALALVDQWRFTSKDVLIHALPVYHTHGLFTATNTLLLSGGQILFRRKFNADDVMALMPEATSMMGVPTFYTRLLQHPGLTRDVAAQMRVFISGSAPLLAETHKEFELRTGHAILERYGMTETSMNTSNPYDGERRAGTVGFPLPHIEVRITDPATGRSLPDGADGMIEVRGPNLFKGYWRNPEKTAEDMRADGFFVTGDLGRYDEDGYLVISGRAKDLIITGGFNVYPKEIESLIDARPDVIESAIIGLPHTDFGEAVTAVIASAGDIDEAALIAELRKELADFKVPKRVIVIPELPRNAMGKVQKAELRKRYAGLYLS